MHRNTRHMWVIFIACALSISATALKAEGSLLQGEQRVKQDIHVGGLRHRAKRALDQPSLADAQKDHILYNLNLMRLRAGASNMNKLEWSDALVEKSQSYSESCLLEVTPGREPIEPFTSWYQSLDFTLSDELEVADIVDTWEAETANYDHESGVCMTGVGSCSRYLQIVRATGKNVGCAYTKCSTLIDPGTKEEWTDAHFLVCLFGNDGENPSEGPYRKGPVCSKCETGIGWCDSGLCREDCSLDAGCPCEIACENCHVITDACTCHCGPGWTGTFCQEECVDRSDNCQGFLKEMCDDDEYGEQTRALCPVTCQMCDAGSTTFLNCPLAVDKTTSAAILNSTKLFDERTTVLPATTTTKFVSPQKTKTTRSPTTKRSIVTEKPETNPTRKTKPTSNVPKEPVTIKTKSVPVTSSRAPLTSAVVTVGPGGLTSGMLGISQESGVLGTTTSSTNAGTRTTKTTTPFREPIATSTRENLAPKTIPVIPVAITSTLGTPFPQPSSNIRTLPTSVDGGTNPLVTSTFLTKVTSVIGKSLPPLTSSGPALISSAFVSPLLVPSTEAPSRPTSVIQASHQPVTSDLSNPASQVVTHIPDTDWSASRIFTESSTTRPDRSQNATRFLTTTTITKEPSRPFTPEKQIVSEAPDVNTGVQGTTLVSDDAKESNTPPLLSPTTIVLPSTSTSTTTSTKSPPTAVHTSKITPTEIQGTYTPATSKTGTKSPSTLASSPKPPPAPTLTVKPSPLPTISTTPSAIVTPELITDKFPVTPFPPSKPPDTPKPLPTPAPITEPPPTSSPETITPRKTPVATTTTRQSNAEICGTKVCYHGGTLSERYCTCLCKNDWHGSRCSYNRLQTKHGVVLKVYVPKEDYSWSKIWTHLTSQVAFAVNYHCDSRAKECCPPSRIKSPNTLRREKRALRTLTTSSRVFYGYGYPQRVLTVENQYMVKTLVYVQREPQTLLCDRPASLSRVEPERRKRNVETNVDVDPATLLPQGVLLAALQGMQVNITSAMTECCQGTLDSVIVPDITETGAPEEKSPKPSSTEIALFVAIPVVILILLGVVVGVVCLRRRRKLDHMLEGQNKPLARESPEMLRSPSSRGPTTYENGLYVSDARAPGTYGRSQYRGGKHGPGLQQGDYIEHAYKGVPNAY